MDDNIRILEDLVNEAVDRLQQTSRERDALRRQVDTLMERLETVGPEADRAGAAGQAGGDIEARRDRARAVLQEALAELRGQSPAA